MIRTVEFLQKLSTIDDVTKYRGILVSRYFLRQYIIVGHSLIPRIPKTGFDLTPGFKSHWKERDPGCKFPPKVQPGS